MTAGEPMMTIDGKEVQVRGEIAKGVITDKTEVGGLEVDWQGDKAIVTRPYQTMQLIVQTVNGGQVTDTHGAARWVDNGHGLHLLQYSSIEATVAAEAAFQSDEEIDYAEPNRIYRAAWQPESEIIYLDPPPGYATGSSIALPNRWGAERVGSNLFKQYLTTNNLLEDELIIAIVDSGVDMNHPFLRGRLLSNGWNFIENNANVNDLHGHGTHVTGILVDNTPSNIKVLPVRALNENNSGTTLGISLGIRYAADNGASVINLSLSGNGASDTYRNSINYALSLGAYTVVAAGNEAQDTRNVTPANSDNVITVSATAQNDRIAHFSNFGDHVDIAAPGVNIFSSVPRGGYQAWQGTSMATPFVTAAVGMLRLYIPWASFDQIKRDLFDATVSVGGGGWNPQFGHGILDFRPFFGRTVDPTGVNLSTNAINTTTGAVRNRFPITADVIPHHATDKSVTFTSSNNNVAYYENGEIVVVGVGTATITAMTFNGFAATCVVTVQALSSLTPLPARPTLRVGDYIRVGTNSWGEEVIAQVTEVHGYNRYRLWSVAPLGVADEFYLYRGAWSDGQMKKDYYWNLSIATQFLTPNESRLASLRNLGKGWNDVNISNPRHNFSNWTLLDKNAQTANHYAAVFASDLVDNWNVREMGMDILSDPRPTRSNIRLFADIDLSRAGLVYTGAGTANNPYRVTSLPNNSSELRVNAPNSLGSITYGASREELRALERPITFTGGNNIEIDKGRTTLLGDSDAFILHMGDSRYPYAGWSIAPRDYYRFNAGDVPYTVSINIVDTTGRRSQAFVTLRVNRRQLHWRAGNNIIAYKEIDGNRSSENARIMNDLRHELANVAYGEHSNLRIRMGSFQFANADVHTNHWIQAVSGFTIEDVGVGRNYIAPTSQPRGIGTIYARGQDPHATPTPRPPSSGGGGGGGGGGSAPATPTPISAVVPTPTLRPDIAVRHVVNFEDLEEVDWAQREVAFLAERGIISGRNEKTFAPKDNIIRADYMVLMMRMLELDGEVPSVKNFKDIPIGAYYTNAVAMARQLEFTFGFENDEFRPRHNITRQDMFAMTYRIMQITGEIEDGDPRFLERFDDYEDIAPYAREAMAALVREGLLRGSFNHLFPRGNATRAETAVFVYRVGRFLEMFD
jgi:hypothetical protein